MDTLVARAARELPGLDAAISYLEASTPLTNFDHTLNPEVRSKGMRTRRRTRASAGCRRRRRFQTSTWPGPGPTAAG